MNTWCTSKTTARMLSAAAAVLLCGGPALAWSVPDTGQTTCYSNNAEISCPAPGEPFYGQDAQYGPNRHSYVKLDSAGNSLPDSAGAWAMVRETGTGLTWEVKHNRDGVLNYDDPNDADNVYTWYDGSAGTPGPGTDTLDFINGLNAERYGGFADWRMPTVKELSLIRDSSRIDPAIDPAFFPNTQADYYWSSTVYAGSAANYWSVYFLAEDVDFYYEHSTSEPARAVRGPRYESGKNFVDNGDGTVTDTDTGFMWQKATAPGTYTWEQALLYCNGLRLAGYTDWRLPNKNELQSLVDYSRSFPAINTDYFPDTRNERYISSTSETGSAGGFWGVNFSRG